MSNAHQNKLSYTSRVGPANLRDVGPLIPAAWTLPRPRLMDLHARSLPEPTPIQGFMLIDTGAAGLIIDASVVRELGLEPTGRSRQGHGLSGSAMFDEYEASLLMPLTDGQGVQNWKGLPVCAWLMPDLRIFEPEGENPPRIVGIIGRLLLRYATFRYDGRNGAVELHIDETALLARREPAQ
jgi:hypothetical protein